MSLSVSDFLKNSDFDVVVVGAGLAGSECTWQLAELGLKVALIEQRDVRKTAAHQGPLFAELVCSNSLKSCDPVSAPGVLKNELSKMNSLILMAAEASKIPAGQALGVDREKFSKFITEKLENHSRVRVLRAGVDHFEELLNTNSSGKVPPIVLATGPLTHENLTNSLKPLVGDKLYFYDAIAPILDGQSINRDIVFKQNRYDKENSEGSSDGDYLNCPLNKEEYENFISALGQAEKVAPHDFEKAIYFQGCQPIEAMLERGPMTLAFGPMKPKGLTDPRTGKEPYACVQLRAEDDEGRAWNMVGFQTKLKYPEQSRIFKMIPGLENAQFFRLGSLHRNTFIHGPALLNDNLALKNHPNIYFAGQICGVEGYTESAAMGALIGRLIYLKSRGQEHPLPPPATTAIGALANAVFNGRMKGFQPMNMNWGLVPLKEISERDKEKREKMASRANRHFKLWMDLF